MVKCKMAFSFFNKEKQAEKYFNRGICYYYGRGVEKSLKAAVRYYTLAAEQGNADAQLNLGWCYERGEWSYERGEGVEKDLNKAVYWYTKAAEQGQAQAQHNLGLCYAYGQGVEIDQKKAVYWYTKAAEQGHAGSQNNLGLCYKKGEGVEKDLKKAVYLFTKAAEQGEVNAQFNLGVCYYHGEGAEKDLNKAVEWYEKAAEMGYRDAKSCLRFCYYSGEGIIKDVEKAKTYWEGRNYSGPHACYWEYYEQENYQMAIDFGERAYLVGNYPRADRMFTLALDKFTSFDNRENSGDLAYLWKGKVYAKLDKYAPALACFNNVVKNASTSGDSPCLTEALREKANILRSLNEIKEARTTLKAALESAITHNQSAMIAEVESELNALPPEDDTLNNVTYLSAETIIQGNIGVYATDDAIVNRPVVGEKGSDDVKNIYCPYCGRQLPVDARFCTACGKQLK